MRVELSRRDGDIIPGSKSPLVITHGQIIAQGRAQAVFLISEFEGRLEKRGLIHFLRSER
jgi:hypothetical protein